MNQITKAPLRKLGYDFIPADHLPEGKDEYYLRFTQHRPEHEYRALNLEEIDALKQLGNTCDDWDNLRVCDPFVPEMIQQCAFYGLVRLAPQESCFREFRDLRRPAGLYRSNIVSCDIGANVVIDNVDFLSHYIVGDDVMIVNTAEIETTDHAKFGNGILKDGEPESMRIRLEVCNENGGRAIAPFDGMLPGDAWLWTRHRGDAVLQEKLLAFTEARFDSRRGYYGVIGDRTVIKNCKIIKDVCIGSDAYLKGANKLKNLTINSSPKSKTQIGEGCELVNGIVGYGCRIFYGVKAVRFILASHSQLKYGARLINSYLGNNSTISCCEVLNSLIFPAHEQHHNNSFLCASLLMGQSNMAAGATVGSNHNSRGSDGELVAGRGFWPGLCVSLKHNSRFASFVILAKGDYPVELDIRLPFALVSNDAARDELVIMPAYWFLHNMYALARNAWKYADRDKRTEKIQRLEYDFLAPDSVGEILEALALLRESTGEAWAKAQTPDAGAGTIGPMPAEADRAAWTAQGRRLLDAADPVVDELEILARGQENSRRKVRLLKTRRAYSIFCELVRYYAATALWRFQADHGFSSLAECLAALPPAASAARWQNVGGQLIPAEAIGELTTGIRDGSVGGWHEVHAFYRAQGDGYPMARLAHARYALQALDGIDLALADGAAIQKLLAGATDTRRWMVRGIRDSRAKDYANPFRRMLYADEAEMNAVLGSLEDNAFIRQEEAALAAFVADIEATSARWGL